MVDATYRWLLCHSALNSKDGLLIGASSLQQLDQNLQAYYTAATVASESSSLSNELLSIFEESWELTKPSAFPYWRSYSADMPNRESLDPGASYSAAKTK